MCEGQSHFKGALRMRTNGSGQNWTASKQRLRGLAETLKKVKPHGAKTISADLEAFIALAEPNSSEEFELRTTQEKHLFNKWAGL